MTPARRIRHGSGITAHDAVDVSGDASNIRAALREADRAASLENRLAEIEREARAILAGAPGPTANDDQTPSDYADRILSCIDVVRAEISRGDATEAARYAMVLGQLVAEARMKSKWEKVAKTGAKCLVGARDGGNGKKGSTLYDPTSEKRDVGDVELAKELDRLLCEAAEVGRKRFRTGIENDRALAHTMSPTGYRKAVRRGRDHLRRGGKSGLRFKDYPESTKPGKVH